MPDRSPWYDETPESATIDELDLDRVRPFVHEIIRKAVEGDLDESTVEDWVELERNEDWLDPRYYHEERPKYVFEPEVDTYVRLPSDRQLDLLELEDGSLLAVNNETYTVWNNPDSFFFDQERNTATAVFILDFEVFSTTTHFEYHQPNLAQPRETTTDL